MGKVSKFAEPKPQSVAVTARKVVTKLIPNQLANKGEKTMKNSTDKLQNVFVDCSKEVVVNTRVKGNFFLQYKKLAVAASLGLVVNSAALP